MEDVKNEIQDRLTLRSELSEIARIPPWIEALAASYSISPNTQFAMNLCLEEALSNVIRHGYGGAANRSLRVSFAAPRGSFEFVVEDEAPAFNPLNVPNGVALDPDGQIRIGGQGIHLMRQFADRIQYERTATGNRLLLSFSARGPEGAV